MLLAILVPDGLARKTYRAIYADHRKYPGEDEDQVVISGEDYHTLVMEDDYNESWQIRAPEGSIVVFDLVTYGYGERVAWDKLAAQKQALDEWARGVCEKHSCSYEIHVGANYW